MQRNQQAKQTRPNREAGPAKRMGDRGRQGVTGSFGVSLQSSRRGMSGGCSGVLRVSGNSRNEKDSRYVAGGGQGRDLGPLPRREASCGLAHRCGNLYAAATTGRQVICRQWDGGWRAGGQPTASRPIPMKRPITAVFRPDRANVDGGDPSSAYKGTRQRPSGSVLFRFSRQQAGTR
jgi:hypothetical protein